DGIRDFHVTGVQTCALPIYAVSGETTAEMRARYGDDIAATYSRFDILWIDGGRNDGHTSLASGEETIANIVAMATAARDAGKLVDRKSVAEGKSASREGVVG